MTNNEIVSRITNGFKLLNKDMRLSRRFVLNVAEKNAEFLISHKLRDRSLFRETSSYSTIECLEMEKIDTFSCGIVEFKSCNKLMRSKKQFKNLIDSRYGNSIKEVTSIDYTKLFTPSTISQYRRNKERLNKYDKTQYFYVKDGYIYIPESDVRKVSVELLVVNTFNLVGLDENKERNCQSAWEYEFKIPAKILGNLIETVRNELITTMQIQEDDNPNMSSRS